jgi:hypothetical protein
MSEAQTHTEAAELCWIDYLVALEAWQRDPTVKNWLMKQAAHQAFTAVYCGETRSVQ